MKIIIILCNLESNLKYIKKKWNKIFISLFIEIFKDYIEPTKKKCC